jgi:hypothetical protein
LATCTTSNLHGKLLSVYENSQACPGAPKSTKERRERAQRRGKYGKKICVFLPPRQRVRREENLIELEKRNPGINSSHLIASEIKGRYKARDELEER